jgi:hypothetical protein
MCCVPYTGCDSRGSSVCFHLVSSLQQQVSLVLSDSACLVLGNCACLVLSLSSCNKCSCLVLSDSARRDLAVPAPPGAFWAALTSFGDRGLFAG